MVFQMCSEQGLVVLGRCLQSSGAEAISLHCLCFLPSSEGLQKPTCFLSTHTHNFYGLALAFGTNSLQILL